MNVTFGRHCGFIDGEHDVKNLIKDSETGLYYFAPVRSQTQGALSKYRTYF